MRLLLRRVSGNSMLPTLRPGQLIIAVHVCRRHYRNGVVVLRYDNKEVIKRIVEQRRHNGEDEIFVCGDNAQQSTDSREYGWLSAESLLGTVIWPRLS